MMNRRAIFVWLTVILAIGETAVFAGQTAQNNQKPAEAPAAATQPQKNAPANVKPANVKDDYVIGIADELYVNVWKEPEMTRAVPVRPDGKITVPLVGDIQASGLTTHQLEANLAKQLESYVSSPSVTVTVTGVHSQKFNIVGEVQKPGTYELVGPPSTVLDAIALAGGLKDFAKSKKIYILRVKEDGSRVRLPFDYKQVIKGENLDQNVVLQSRDTIVVP